MTHHRRTLGLCKSGIGALTVAMARTGRYERAMLTGQNAFGTLGGMRGGMPAAAAAGAAGRGGAGASPAGPPGSGAPGAGQAAGPPVVPAVPAGLLEPPIITVATKR